MEINEDLLKRMIETNGVIIVEDGRITYIFEDDMTPAYKGISRKARELAEKMAKEWKKTSF